ncbi:hypothetical protein FRB98_007912 [Tulasnella sp. 332]|nr:hypothetical protein FRB98_007912 [Tulasnella sp. 332]
MEIVKARSALLSNYEVYKLLMEQRRQHGENGNADTNRKGKGKAHDFDEPDGAIATNSNSTTGTVPPNLAKIQDEQTIEYLKIAPHATLRQNEPSIARLLEELRPIGNRDEGGAGLTKAEKLMVVNLAPTTDVELYTSSNRGTFLLPLIETLKIVEELEDRFPSEMQTILDLVSNSLLPEPMLDVEATNGLVEGDDGAGGFGFDEDGYGEAGEDGYGEYEQPQEYYSEPVYGDRPDTPPELDES